MKRFTCTEKKLKFVHADTNAVVTMEEGDSLSLPDAQVQEFCGYGWGTSDDFETGERKEGAVELNVTSTIETTTSAPEA